MTIRVPFTPWLLLGAPRRSAAVPNPSGTLVAYTQTTYSFDTHSTASELRVLDVPTGKSTVLTDSYSGAPQWLDDGDDDILVWLKGGDNGNTSFIIGDARGREKPYTAGVVPGPVSDLKLTIIAPGTVGVAVSGKGNPDGTLYNSSGEKKPLSSGKLYSSTFVRHWDAYIEPQKNSIFYGTLQRSPGGAAKYALSGLNNLLHSLNTSNLESPVPPFGGGSDFDISPKGIVFLSKDPNLNGALHTKVVAYIVPLPNWTQALSTQPHTVKLPSALNGALASPAISPVHNTLAILAMRQDGYESDKNRIVIVEDIFGGNGGAQALELFSTAAGAGSWDRSPSSVSWSHDDSSLLILAQDLGQTSLFQLPIGGGDVSALTTDHLIKLTDASSGSVSDITDIKGKLFLSTSTYVESSLYSALDVSSGSGHRNLTVLSSASRNGAAFGLSPNQIDDFWFTGAEGHKVHSWILKPSRFEHGKKYPLAFLIHGGPQGAWNNGWSTRWNPAIWSEQGYVVVLPNPTGSTGYGQGFTDAIQNNWGGSPYQDLVNAFEYIEGNLDYVDTKRAVALGASYGGYMINWIQGHDLGRKFKALVCHDGVFSTRYQVATDELYFPFHDLGGAFWENVDKWDQWDPARHLNNWATPQLTIHSSLDYRLTIAEGLATFNVLQTRGVDSEFLTFPDENHFVTKPENSLVWHKTAVNWVNKYVGLPLLGDKPESDSPILLTNDDGSVRLVARTEKLSLS